MSNDNPVNYEAVLADLRAKRDQIDAAIAALAPLAGITTNTTSGSNVSSGGKATIRSDEFFGMTILEASKKYLGMMTRPQSGQTITDALKAGGYYFTSEQPLQTVNSLLNRDHNSNGEVVRVGKGVFGLAKWYPNRPRVRRAAEDDQEDDETPPPDEATDTPDTTKGESNPEQTT